MNWFKFYIGDYQRDTAHLSVTEHGAYVLMLQHYYATEKPLPSGKALHRMLRAQDKEERDAIDTVAAQFWEATEAGLVNARADRELARTAAQASTNRDTAIAREAARRAARAQHAESTNRATNEPLRARVPDTRHQTVPPSAGAGAPANSSEVVFGSGIPLLTAAGVSEKSARSMLGLMRKQHGDPAVIDALQRCAQANPLQPVPWLQAALRNSPPSRSGVGVRNFDATDYHEGVNPDGTLAV